MRTRFPGLAAACLISFGSVDIGRAASGTNGICDLNTPRDFPTITSAQQWRERAKQIRQHVLVSCGLWPLPEKTPLNPHIFGKIERDGYTIEKVYFETFPGLFLAGNLYRPTGHGKGPFPAILNPHGHWSNGRMADNKDGSIAARCINFARQGMIAFSYDMVGFNDTHFTDSPTNKPFYEVHRMFATNREDLLWNISLMGVQTWNSIRAVDFLESLPDADRKRLACTGESGGGTQTFMLGAVEDRLAAQAPVVMVSHIMQGGCLCENAPGLRVEYSNMEIAAAAAPRSQILVAATGDWTKDTPKVEGPAIEKMYQLLGFSEKFHYVQFNFDHNYNQTSREAVYEWFDHWLLKQPRAPVKEVAYQKEPDDALRVFPDNHLPEGAMSQDQFVASLKKMHRRQWENLLPLGREVLGKFQENLRPAWQHTLQLDWPSPKITKEVHDLKTDGEFTTATLEFRRPGEAASVTTTYWAPARQQSSTPKIVVLCSGDGATDGAQPGALASALLKRKFAVLAIKQFSSGEPPDQFDNFYCTYNRTKMQSRVRDLVTACTGAAWANPREAAPFRVFLCGTGQGGPWALMAAPAAEGVVADANKLNLADEQTLLAPDLFSPGLLSMGGFTGAALLAAPHSLVLHNVGGNFATQELASTYHTIGADKKLKLDAQVLPDDRIAALMAEMK